jgi:transcriptional accessory protein Tex/SPT6
MDFPSFVKARRREVFESVDRKVLLQVGRALERSDEGLSTLLANDDACLGSLPESTIARLADIQREFDKWKEVAKGLRRAVAQNTLSLPDGIMNRAYTRDELDCLSRAARMCQRSGYPNHDQWANAVQAHLDLWRTAIQLSLKGGMCTVRLADPGAEEADEFATLTVTKASFEEIRSYKWLAIRRGARHDELTVELHLPWQDIEHQAETRLQSLGLRAQERGSREIVKELITSDLELTILSLLDQVAENEALDSAKKNYTNLLATPAVKSQKTIAVYIAKEDSPAGVAILDKKGDVIEQTQIAVEEDITSELAGIIDHHSPEVAALQISSPDHARLSKIERLLDSMPVHRVHDVAIADARKNSSHQPWEASAIVIGRRLIKPGREWGRVDPLLLNLGEYQRELDADKLRAVLEEAKLLSAWIRKQKSSGKTGPSSQMLSRSTPGKQLNSFVKTIRDLRPGMVLDGIVTNITRFGAFVNIGLPTEGMIHVSQLSVEFVEDPADVIRVGEQVKARILEVIPDKKRIALSLKPELERAPMPDKSSRISPASQALSTSFTAKPKASQPAPKQAKRYQKDNSPPKSRSDALADLDALFKK